MNIFRFAILLSALSSGSVQATGIGGLGGYMSACENAPRVNQVCMDQTVQAATRSYAGTLRGQASYLTRDFNQVKISLRLTFQDRNNYFGPEAKLPLLGRATVCGYHRDCNLITVSLPMVLDRVTGKRELVGQVEFTTKNNFGAEYVEHTQQLQVFIPGSSEVLTFKFSK